MADERPERPSGLGRPLDDVLQPGSGPPSAGVSDMFGGAPADPDADAPVLELLGLAFPGTVVGLCRPTEADPTTYRIRGHVPEEGTAWAVSGALRAVLQLGRPHVLGPPEAPVYAMPMGRDGAIAVHRRTGVLDDRERRLLELLARRVR
jgi:hypothetical protein